MKKALPLLCFALGLLVGGGAGLVYAFTCRVPIPPVNDDRFATRPTREEVLRYLDGKAVRLSDPKRLIEPTGPAHTIRREQIEAIDVSTSSTRINSGPWETEVQLLLNIGEGRYAVQLEVQHQLVERVQLFYGYEVKKVVRQ